jgi:hypothetical protein
MAELAWQQSTEATRCCQRNGGELQEWTGDARDISESHKQLLHVKVLYSDDHKAIVCIIKHIKLMPLDHLNGSINPNSVLVPIHVITPYTEENYDI